MQSRDQPADEPFESQDLELGSALSSWAESHSGSLSMTLQGPLDAPGMDPTWLLHLTGRLIEAEVVLFYGPYVDISVVCSTGSNDELYVGGERDITASRLVEMLDDLAAAERGADLPSWLRPAPDSLVH
ncbi:hypothetical protein ACWKSP_27180 [Micromonosporaceae bacterium Da 78-11]